MVLAWSLDSSVPNRAQWRHLRWFTCFKWWVQPILLIILLEHKLWRPWHRISPTKVSHLRRDCLSESLVSKHRHKFALSASFLACMGSGPLERLTIASWLLIGLRHLQSSELLFQTCILLHRIYRCVSSLVEPRLIHRVKSIYGLHRDIFLVKGCMSLHRDHRLVHEISACPVATRVKLLDLLDILNQPLSLLPEASIRCLILLFK